LVLLLPSRNELNAAYQAVSGRLTAAATNAVGARFSSLGSWRDDDVPAFVAGVSTTLLAVKRQSARLALAYYAQIALIEGERFVAPVVGSQALSTESLRGVPALTVYSRPFVSLRMALGSGALFSDALAAGIVRAKSLAGTEIALSRRATGLAARSGNRNITGYRRTLSGAENCSICEVAASNRYGRGDLMPIHAGCDCGEEPIYGSPLPRVVAPDEPVDSRFGSEVPTSADIIVHEHGELGPVLSIRGQHFTGPNDI
jgi:hypothetical protein